MPDVRKVEKLNTEALRPLLEISLTEGYNFIQRLQEEYLSGTNDFTAPGALLLDVYEDERMIGIGGVHPDHYLNDPKIGRIRHIYVLPEKRRDGIGSLLMNALIQHSALHFNILTLRTLTTHGDSFYKSLGFVDEPRYENATHWMDLRNGNSG